jgi:hypothetical protein
MCLSEDNRVEATIRKDDIRVSAPLVKSFNRERKCMKIGSLEAVGIGCSVSFITVTFSLTFPYILTPTESNEIYRPAFYNYDSSLSHFDTSIWTYATDYALMVVMLCLASFTLIVKGDELLKRRAAGLLLCYALSVAAGGLAHQIFLTTESRNTLAFRFLWTMCVGTVTAAGGFMGACGSHLGRLTGGISIPENVWFSFGAFSTAVCMAGFMSFQRPACDIFIAGITQFPPTVYICLLAMYSQFRPCYRNLCIIGFSLNAPLLPLYAILIYHFNWSLPKINTFLHMWLCVAWTSQGLALRHFAVAATRRKFMESTNSKAL